MARTTNATGSGRPKGKRRMALVWIAVAAAIIIGLIWKEQVALLYVLATLSVTGLLLIVAFADLGGAQRPLTQPAPNDDAAAVGDGLGATSGVTTRAARRR
jgi:hypothetical protein